MFHALKSQFIKNFVQGNFTRFINRLRDRSHKIQSFFNGPTKLLKTSRQDSDVLLILFGHGQILPEESCWSVGVRVFSLLSRGTV